MNSFFNIAFRSSINRFLLTGILSFTVIYLVSIYTLSQKQAIHEIEELFDAQLAHSSNILINLLGESVSTIDQSSVHLPVIYFGIDEETTDISNEVRYQKKVAYQIYNDQDKLLIVSGSAPNTRFAAKQEGYSNIELEDDTWRVYSLYDEDWNFWLHVGESVSIREELADQIARQTLWPGIALLPIVLILLVFIIRLALSPLKQLTHKIQNRDPKNLSEISLTKAPKEIRPVVDAINHLFIRLNEAIAREKRLTADAAHELRTPLSVIMIHAQNALAANSDEERNTSLKELELATQRISRLLEQLLTLSKVSPETIPVSQLNIHSLCQEVLAQMALPIINKNQELEMICEDSLKGINIEGSEFLIEILLRNVIENASEYSPEGGVIQLSISENQNYVILRVEDSGKGVESENYERLTDRFYREQQNIGKGAGLGLYLVSNIVEFHHGELNFETSRLGGLAVIVSLLKQFSPKRI